MTKVKHISGIYINLPDAPTTEDVKYYIESKNKKILNKDALMKAFGSEKEEKIDAVLSDLVLDLTLSQIEPDKYKVN